MSKSPKLNLKIVTGADSSHFKSLVQLCESIKKYEPELKIVIYDLGLSNSEVSSLKKLDNIERVTKFNYSKYPDFVNINSVNFGSYAWKPLIIEKETKNSNEMMLWMDAGNIITKNLKNLKSYIDYKGFYSPYSSNNIVKWTHPVTLHLLNVSSKIYKKRNLNAAIIGINPLITKINQFIEAWIESSKNQEIIGPIGSDKSNHRFDQSVLTIKYYQSNFSRFFCKTYNVFGIKLHQDID